MLKQRNRNVLMILIFESLVGPGTFEWIPYWLAHSRTGVWAPFLMYVLISALVAWVLVSVTFRMELGPIRPVTIFNGLIQTRWLVWTLNGLLFMFCLAQASSALRVSMNLIKYIALPYTPMAVLAGLAMVVTLQLFSGGLDAFLRYQAGLFWPTITIGLMMLLLSLGVSDRENLLPLWPVHWHDVFGLFPQFGYLMTGWCLAAVYLPVFRLAGVERAPMRRRVLSGFLMAAALQALNLFVVLVDFGPYEGASLYWPVFEAVRMQPEGRWVVLFLLPVLVASTSAINLYTFAAYRIALYYRRKRTVLLGMSIALTVMGLSLLPVSMQTLFHQYVWVLNGIEIIVFATAVFLVFKQRIWEGG